MHPAAGGAWCWARRGATCATATLRCTPRHRAGLALARPHKAARPLPPLTRCLAYIPEPADTPLYDAQLEGPNRVVRVSVLQLDSLVRQPTLPRVADSAQVRSRRGWGWGPGRGQAEGWCLCGFVERNRRAAPAGGGSSRAEHGPRPRCFTRSPRSAAPSFWPRSCPRAWTTTSTACASCCPPRRRRARPPACATSSKRPPQPRRPPWRPRATGQRCWTRPASLA